AEMRPALMERLPEAGLVIFDGTLWTDDEMNRDCVRTKTLKRRSHMSIRGKDGSIAAFRELGVKRRIFIHINTPNPVLIDDTPERREVEAAGWEVAYDGMDIEL